MAAAMGEPSGDGLQVAKSQIHRGRQRKLTGAKRNWGNGMSVKIVMECYGMLWNGSFLHSTFTTRKVVNFLVNVSMDAEPGVCWRPTLRSDWMTFKASESRRR